MAKKPYVFDRKLLEKNVPYALRNRRQFICWKDKIPVSHWSGRPVSVTEPKHWITFNQALDAVEQKGYDGIGIVLTRGLVGIDLDDVRDAEGNYLPEAQEIMDTVQSYTELSPSQTGVHILAFADIPRSARTKFLNEERTEYFKKALEDAVNDHELYNQLIEERNEEMKSFEIYDDARYFTLTGMVDNNNWYPLKGKDHTNANTNAIFNKYYANPNNDLRNDVIRRQKLDLDFGSEIGSSGLSDEEIMTKILRSKERIKERYNGKNIAEEVMIKGNIEEFFPDRSNGDFIVTSWIAFYTDSYNQTLRIIENSAIWRDKWERKDYQEYNIKNANENLWSRYGERKNQANQISEKAQDYEKGIDAVNTQTPQKEFERER